MNKILLLIGLLICLSCSTDDNNGNNNNDQQLTITVTVVAISDHTATLNWTIEGNTNPVTFEIILNGQEIIDGFDGYQYTLEDLDEVTDYSGKVFAKEQGGIQTFGDFFFTTQLDKTYEGDLTITTQDEIDTFYYISISGDLVVFGQDIVDLNGLSSLENVGHIKIENTSITTLNGLHNLQEQFPDSRTITLLQNTLLEDVSDLSNISSELMGISIKDCISLSNLTGLGLAENSSSVGLTIENSAVENLDVFTNLKVAAGVYLRDLSYLSSIEGLSNLESVSYDLELENLPNLTSLEGLNNLTLINRNLIIDRLNSLLTLDGFSNLETVNGSIKILNSSQLTSIAALENVELGSEQGLFLEYLESLESLQGLNSIQGLGRLSLENLDSIETLEGLNNLLSVINDFRIINMSNLQSLTGLENLWNASNYNWGYNDIGWFVLSNLPLLSSFNPLLNLKSVGGLGISNCPLITNLDGFANLQYTHNQGAMIAIHHNLILSDFCGLTEFALLNDTWDPEYILGNAYNPTWDQIRSETECSQ